MRKNRENIELDDVDKIKNYLNGLGFICQSQPSSQNLVYSKKEEVVMIKNNKKSKNKEVDMK